MGRITRPPATAAAIIVVAIVLAAIFAPWIAPADPYSNNLRLRLCPIGGGRCPQFLLGADNQGRDMLSRLLFGLRATLMIGVIAVVVGGGVGATLGLLAAFYRRLDAPLMRLVESIGGLRASMTETRSPLSLAAIAVAIPAGPPPTTRTSCNVAFLPWQLPPQKHEFRAEARAHRCQNTQRAWSGPAMLVDILQNE